MGQRTSIPSSFDKTKVLRAPSVVMQHALFDHSPRVLTIYGMLPVCFKPSCSHREQELLNQVRGHHSGLQELCIGHTACHSQPDGLLFVSAPAESDSYTRHKGVTRANRIDHRDGRSREVVDSIRENRQAAVASVNTALYATFFQPSLHLLSSVQINPRNQRSVPLSWA